MEKIYKKINIIGCGFVGLTTGLGLATKGFNINFIDIDQSKINSLKKGKINFYENGLKELLHKIDKSKIKFTSNYTSIAQSGATFICVDTPSKKNGNIELKYLISVINKIENIKFTKKHLLIFKSTLTPGTTDQFYKKIKNMKNLHLANNPEFLREGTALYDFLNPDRIVFGCYDDFSYSILKYIYKGFKTKTFKLSPSEAEYSKYFSNIFFANLISFANEFSNSLNVNKNVNYKNILSTFAYDKRIALRKNNKFYFPSLLSYLTPGPGYGGSCFPKDTLAFNSFLRNNKIDNKLTKSVIEINNNRDREIINIFKKLIKGIINPKILIFGLSFKAESDDLRNSKSLVLYKNIKKIKDLKSEIFFIDPYIKDLSVINKYNVISIKKIHKINFDLLIIMNRYKELKEINFKKIDGKIKNILDTRNCINETFKNSKLSTIGIY